MWWINDQNIFFNVVLTFSKSKIITFLFLAHSIRHKCVTIPVIFLHSLIFSPPSFNLDERNSTRSKMKPYDTCFLALVLFSCLLQPSIFYIQHAISNHRTLSVSFQLWFIFRAPFSVLENHHLNGSISIDECLFLLDYANIPTQARWVSTECAGICHTATLFISRLDS